MMIPLFVEGPRIQLCTMAAVSSKRIGSFSSAAPSVLELSQTNERVADRYLILRLAVLLTEAEIARGFPERALEPALDRGEHGFLIVEVIDREAK